MCGHGHGSLSAKSGQWSSRSQGAANQFEMRLEESLFLLVLYQGMKTKLGLRGAFKKTFNKWPTCCYPSENVISEKRSTWNLIYLFFVFVFCVNTELKVVFPDICCQIYWQ